MSDFVGYGAAFSLAVVVVLLFFVLVEQSAARWAAVTGVLGAGAVGVAEWWLFSINRAVAEFALVPSILIGLAAMYWSARTIYRRLAVIPPGETKGSGSDIKVEDETLERQNELWCRLRDLPHFRETLKGDLINLVSGDVLSWASVNDARCIEMALAGKTVLTASRFETLRKYWSVQQAVANLLFPRFKTRGDLEDEHEGRSP